MRRVRRTCPPAPSAFARARARVDEIGRNSPARLAITVFASVIALVTGFLSLPVATASGQRAPFVDALFTAVSAVCVTGLVTVDTATYWSGFGQVVILVAIKVGGLGVITLAALLGLAVSRRLGLTGKLLAQNETKAQRLGEVGTLLRVVIGTSLVIEAVLTLVLFPRFLVLRGDRRRGGLARGLLRHQRLQQRRVPLAPRRAARRRGRRLVAVRAARRRRAGRQRRLPRAGRRRAGLAVAAASGACTPSSPSRPRCCCWWCRCSSSAGSSGPTRARSVRSPLDEKVLATLFMAVMPRSGGFATLDVGAMRGETWLATDMLMFIGGGSASTAGGIKVTTLAVLFLAVVAEARGDSDVEAFGRRIPAATMRLSVTVLLVGSTLVAVVDDGAAGHHRPRARRRPVRGAVGVRHLRAVARAHRRPARTRASTCSPR